MKTSIRQLPRKKQIELEIVVNMIREEFDVDMIILFGSYARGDWVEELGPDKFYYNYQSDFDILVVADRKYAKKHHKSKVFQNKGVKLNESYFGYQHLES